MKVFNLNKTESFQPQQNSMSEFQKWTDILTGSLRWGGCFISTLLDGILQARIQDFLKGGGGVKTFTSTPPWTLSAWRHPPSEKLKNTPTLGHSQAPPPPLGHCPCDVIHIPRGGGGDDRSRSRIRTLSCIGFQYRDKFKGGGGVIISVTSPGPESATVLSVGSVPFTGL